MTEIWDALRHDFFRRAVAEAVMVGMLGGLAGVHVILRRLQFFVVAVSHATFPGVVVAALVGISLFAGGLFAGLLVAGAVVAVDQARRMDHASAIGVVLAGSFALGVVIMTAQPGSGGSLRTFLVGSILTVQSSALVTTTAAGLFVIAVLLAFNKELVMSAFDRAGSSAVGYRVERLDLLVLVLIVVVVVVAIPAVGTLLAVALLTVPAISARMWTTRVKGMLLLGPAFGVLASVSGLLASAAWDIAPGGAIALSAVAVFAISWAGAAIRERRRLIPA